jgi:uncharacterized protein
VIEYPAGTPSWVDVTSPDLDASARFYGELLGWQARDAGGGYRMFWIGDAVVAGLGAVQEGHPPAWTTYVAVDDADAAKERVEAAGGKTLLEPVQVMDAGSTAIFADSAGGAVFGVWQSERHRGAQLVNAVGALTMNELRTRDMDGAARFYGDVFGWQLEPIEQGGAVVYGALKLDGRLIAGLLPMGEGFPAEVPPHWAPYFGVEDLEASVATAQDLGGRALTGTMAVPSGRFTALLDPNGAAFSLFQGSYDPPPGA